MVIYNSLANVKTKVWSVWYVLLILYINLIINYHEIKYFSNLLIIRGICFLRDGLLSISEIRAKAIFEKGFNPVSDFLSLASDFSSSALAVSVILI